jgi:hypothetical protein
MPTYQIECPECGLVKDQRFTFSEYDKVKSGEETLQCGNCGCSAQFAFSPGSLGFIFKEGESGGWASKAIRENAYRKKRRKEMARREKDHVFQPRLQPNFDGVETGTWKDAQELARKEKGNASASTFVPLVKKEQLAIT